jgi:hypothetical protein
VSSFIFTGDSLAVYTRLLFEWRVRSETFQANEINCRDAVGIEVSLSRTLDSIARVIARRVKSHKSDKEESLSDAAKQTTVSNVILIESAIDWNRNKADENAR